MFQSKARKEVNNIKRATLAIFLRVYLQTLNANDGPKWHEMFDNLKDIVSKAIYEGSAGE